MGEPDLKAIWQAVNQHSIVSIADVAGAITYANDAFVKISGYSREELLGQNHRNLKSNLQANEFWKNMWDTVSAGYVWRGEVCNRAKDGSLYWVDAQIFPLFDINGIIEQYISIRTDITTHKQQQKQLELTAALKATATALRLRELYLQATLDNLPFLFWLKDNEGRYLAVNQKFADACTHASPQTVVGLTDFDLWPADLANFYRSIDARVMARSEEKMREEPHESEGETRWVETYIRPLFGDAKNVIGTVGYSHDITERKLAYIQLQGHTDLLDAIFEVSPDGFISFDHAYRVSYASPAFSRMTGIDSSELYELDEQGFTDLLAQRCDAGGRFNGFDGLRKIAASDRLDERTLIEISMLGKRTLEVGLRISESRTVSQILYFRDVTSEVELDQMKSEFLATAAHELRTPMASIYGFAEVLMTHDLDEENRKEFSGIIYKQSEWMIAILNELLDLARIESRRGKDFVFEVTSVQDLIFQVVNGFKQPDGRLAATLLMPCTPVYIMADHSKAQQAILNVLSNAYKYSPAGGLVKIELIESIDSGATPRVGVRITDEGIGMTSAQLERVFERFYRADTSGTILGTGLGMSIVHEIVLLHGGSVEITSQPGQGTAVTLWMNALLKETMDHDA